MEVEKENGHTMCEVKTPPDTENTAKKEAETMEKASSLWNAQMQGGASVVSSEHAAIDSETLYTQVCRDENVRLKIIGEYLSSLGKSDAPLMRGGVGTLTTPPKRAASISEAGDMALLYLKKPTTR